MNRTMRLVAGAVLAFAAPVAFFALEPATLEVAPAVGCAAGVAWGPRTADVTHVLVAGGLALVALLFLASCLIFPARPRPRSEDTYSIL